MADSSVITKPVVEAEQQHPEKDEIIRQAEYYFSDENLPTDAHLLALAGGDGNGKVELKKILAFKRMRPFKPKSQVIAALRDSADVEIIDDKWIRRRTPLTIPLAVTPQPVAIGYTPIEIPADKPWITKGMLRPTGFEVGHVDAPINPAQYAIEREIYSPENSFISRIEEATNRFCRNRKMHQTTRNIFVKFMRFGGVVGGQGQIGSAANRKQLLKDGCDADEVDRLTAYFGVDNDVVQSFEEENQDEGECYVDFVEVAKGFLSSHFMIYFPWEDGDMISTACNILQNYYNYLLVHDVCPEYKVQIVEAQNVCRKAEDELTRLIQVEKQLPGDFNIACSTLFGGYYAGLYRPTDAEWHEHSDHANIGISLERANTVFNAGFPTRIESDQVLGPNEGPASSPKGDETAFKTNERHVGLEVLQILQATGEKVDIAIKSEGCDSGIKATGKLVCQSWNIPYEKQVKPLANGLVERVELIVEREVLTHCFVGMKLDATIMTSSNGVTWFDQLHAAHPSYFTWLHNEEGLKREVNDCWADKPERANNSESVQAEVDNTDGPRENKADEEEDGDDEEDSASALSDDKPYVVIS